MPKDLLTACVWYLSAAANGYDYPSTEWRKTTRAMTPPQIREAQFQLGRSFSSGTHVPQNHVLAYAWFENAQRNGHAQAMDLRDDAADHLTTNQMANAKAQADYLANLFPRR